ncbi:MAG: hypothetical protein IBX58_02620 [Roseovarius sp.]|nr:hypothetical protein [Roseovarius sp.]
MPIIRIDLCPGREHDIGKDISSGIACLLDARAGMWPAATTVIFPKITATNRVVGGKPCAAPGREGR